jgi:hypothetical protein
MRDWQLIGKHRICRELDVVYWESHGSVGLDEIRQFYALAEGVLAQYRWVGLIIDVRDAGLPSPEARRFIANWEQRHPESEGVTICFGASPLMLVIARLIFHAIKMLTPRRSSGPFFVATEAEAQAILSAHRPAGRSPKPVIAPSGPAK